MSPLQKILRSLLYNGHSPTTSLRSQLYIQTQARIREVAWGGWYRLQKGMWLDSNSARESFTALSGIKDIKHLAGKYRAIACIVWWFYLFFCHSEKKELFLVSLKNNYDDLEIITRTKRIRVPHLGCRRKWSNSCAILQNWLHLFLDKCCLEKWEGAENVDTRRVTNVLKSNPLTKSRALLKRNEVILVSLAFSFKQHDIFQGIRNILLQDWVFSGTLSYAK